MTAVHTRAVGLAGSALSVYLTESPTTIKYVCRMLIKQKPKDGHIVSVTSDFFSQSGGDGFLHLTTSTQYSSNFPDLSIRWREAPFAPLLGLFKHI